MTPYEMPLATPEIDPSVFIADGARVVGNVRIGRASSVWFNAVIRGDVEAIRVGCRTNIQDLAVLHADPDFPCLIGDDVTVGHSAIVHGATVGDGVLIGMRAVVMNGAKIGAGSLIAAGAIVLEGMEIPPGSLVMGAPARIKRTLDPADQSRLTAAAEHYVQNARRFLAMRSQSKT